MSATSEPVEPTAAAEETVAEADDQKAKFLAALARKQGGKGATGGGPGGESKIHGTHAAAGGKRNFRRKSGG